MTEGPENLQRARRAAENANVETNAEKAMRTWSRRQFLAGSAVAAVAVGTASLRTDEAESRAKHESEDTLARLGELALLSTLGSRFSILPARTDIDLSRQRLKTQLNVLRGRESTSVIRGARWWRDHVDLSDVESMRRDLAQLPPNGSRLRGHVEAASTLAILAAGTHFTGGKSALGRLWLSGMVQADTGRSDVSNLREI